VSWLRSRWFGRVQTILGIVILVLLTANVVKQWDRVRESGVSLVFRPLWLLASLGIVWLMWIGLIEGWRRIAWGWGARMDWRLGGRIWMLSSFAKYIPGKVWAAASMVTMSERAGVHGASTLAAAVVMQVLGVGTGVAVAALTVGPEIRSLYADAGAAMTLLGVVSAGMLLLVGNRSVLRYVWLVARREGPAPEPPRPVLLLFAVLMNVLSWLAYGLALLWLARGLVPEAGLTWRQATGGFAASYIIGYLGPAPGGLGMRDLALFGVLGLWIEPGPALALAAASRLMFTLNELGAAAPFYFSRESTRDLA
jgi:hypothetical protein